MRRSHAGVFPTDRLKDRYIYESKDIYINHSRSPYISYKFKQLISEYVQEEGQLTFHLKELRLPIALYGCKMSCCIIRLEI